MARGSSAASRSTPLPVELVRAPAEELPFEDGSSTSPSRRSCSARWRTSRARSARSAGCSSPAAGCCSSSTCAREEPGLARWQDRMNGINRIIVALRLQPIDARRDPRGRLHDHGCAARRAEEGAGVCAATRGRHRHAKRREELEHHPIQAQLARRSQPLDFTRSRSPAINNPLASMLRTTDKTTRCCPPTEPPTAQHLTSQLDKDWYTAAQPSERSETSTHGNCWQPSTDRRHPEPETPRSPIPAVSRPDGARLASGARPRSARPPRRPPRQAGPDPARVPRRRPRREVRGRRHHPPREGPGQAEGGGALPTRVPLRAPPARSRGCTSRRQTSGPPEVGEPAEGAGDTAHAEKAARGDDHPVGEGFQERLELGGELPFAEQHRSLAELLRRRKPVRVTRPGARGTDGGPLDRRARVGRPCDVRSLRAPTHTSSGTPIRPGSCGSDPAAIRGRTPRAGSHRRRAGITQWIRRAKSTFRSPGPRAVRKVGRRGDVPRARELGDALGRGTA